MITGFDVIRQGITLKNTQNATQRNYPGDYQITVQHPTIKIWWKTSRIFNSRWKCVQGLARFDSGYLLGDDGDMRVSLSRMTMKYTLQMK